MKQLPKKVIRFFYLPLFLIVGNGVAIYLVAQAYPKYWLVIWILMFVGLSFLVERLEPFNRVFNDPLEDQVRDFLHSIVNEMLTVFGILSLPLIQSYFVFFPIWPNEISIVIQLILALLVADIGISVAHYASHRISILWHLHAVHHSVKRLYGFNGLMKHPFHQLIETVAGVTPLIVLGVPSEVLTLVAVAVVLQLLIQHSNVNYFVGPLKYVLAVNSLHRFHHLNTAKEGDVNFGLFTTLTDHVLGTWFYEEDCVVKSEDLGISAEPNYPIDYLPQFLAPFRQRG